MAKRKRKQQTKQKKGRDRAGRPRKATQAVAAARLNEVLDMVARGFTTAAIVRHGAENWNLKRRGIEKYLTKAYEVIHKELAREYPKKVATLVARQDAIYTHAMEPVPKFNQGIPLYYPGEGGAKLVVERDLGTARQAVMDQAKLLGLFSEKFEFDFGEHADPYPDVPVDKLIEKARVFE